MDVVSISRMEERYVQFRFRNHLSKSMTHGEIAQLLKSTLVVVAHPDDESIGCGILLQRIADAGIILCTDGSPRIARPWYARTLRNPRLYAKRRLAEFNAAVRIAGVRRISTMAGIHDQMLYSSLERAAINISRVLEEYRPDAILTHAFEGGHPDHDACAFLANWAGHRFSLPVWEMPLYFRPTPSASLIYQHFLSSNGTEVTLRPCPSELRKKELMLSQHRSQAGVVSEFDRTLEVFRPQPAYDFGVSPNPAVSTYAVCESIAISSTLERFCAFQSAKIPRSVEQR
jgi:LmbE family N-acetylglucosaminyl deacetylase